VLRRRSFIRHSLTLVSALLIGAFSLPASAGAQSENGPRIEIELPSATSLMTVRMRNGFDVRIRMRAELWKSGRIFNSIVARQEWDVIVHFDQFDQTFDVARIDQNMNVEPQGTYRRLVDAKAALALPYSPPMGRPTPGEEHYYSVQADISTLDLNDLDEVSAWLRGELAPAVQGRRNPGTALGRGVRTLLSRVMGGEVRRLEARSPRFRVTPGG